MNIVVDTSAALAWCFQDEASDADLVILERLRAEAILVPSLWHLELANAIALAASRGRISLARGRQFIALVGELGVVVDTRTPALALSSILGLAHSERLTAYDAAYLELAMREGAALASKDRALCANAARLGVEVIAA